VAAVTVLVGDPADELVRALRPALGRLGLTEAVVPPGALALAPLAVTPCGAWLGHARIAGLVLRAGTERGCADDFRPAGRAFASAEARATLLAVAHAPGVLAVAPLQAEDWQRGGEWPLWRRRLAAAGVALAPMSVGASAPGLDGWLPYTALGRHVAPRAVVARALGAAHVEAGRLDETVTCCGAVIAGPVPPSALLAGPVLDHTARALPRS
jgi:hypothetical protein